MPPQLAAHAAAGSASANPTTAAMNRMDRMSLISHSRAVSARIGASPQDTVLQYGDGMGLPFLAEPVRHGQDIVAAADEGLTHGDGHAALQPDQVRRVARFETSHEEAWPLDGLLDLHAEVERVGEDLGVKHRLPVTAHVGEPQHRPPVARHA